MIRIGFSKDVHPLVPKDARSSSGGIQLDSHVGCRSAIPTRTACSTPSPNRSSARSPWATSASFFPKTDPRYKNYDSTLILKEVYDYVSQEGLRTVSNLDCMVSLEAPKLRPYVDEMRTPDRRRSSKSRPSRVSDQGDHLRRARDRRRRQGDHLRSRRARSKPIMFMML
ncbi:MAG: 2-C-methyl-D-erythritol 2,4-cyclodiphosphate synthase [Bacillus subtilis]|nr:2-C-methyl-D-erythritol 2,4-cyclodiphosphate synthase [Bacillus subtilis]